MSKKLSKEILKHSVLSGLIFAALYFFPLLINKYAMFPTYEDITCVDIDGDGIFNDYDQDIDGDGILNSEDPDIDGDNNIDDDKYILPICDIKDIPWTCYYPYLVIFLGPVLSVLFYRKKVQTLIYRECFSICFLTLSVGSVLGQLIMMFIYTSFSFNMNQFLITLQGSVMSLVIFAAYSFLLALFLKKIN